MIGLTQLILSMSQSRITRSSVANRRRSFIPWKLFTPVSLPATLYHTILKKV